MGLLQNLPEGDNLPSELTQLGKVIFDAGKKTGDKLGQDISDIIDTIIDHIIDYSKMNKDVIRFLTKAFVAVTSIAAGTKLGKIAVNDAKRIPTGNNKQQK